MSYFTNHKSFRWISLSLFSSVLFACSPAATPAVPEAEYKGSGNAAAAEKESEVSQETPTTEADPQEKVEQVPTETEPVQKIPSEEEVVKTPVETETPVVVAPTPEAPKPEPAPVLVVPNGKYVIRSVPSQRCLDIPNASSLNGLGLEIYDCWNEPSPPQTFELIHVGNKFYQIKNVATGKSLEVRGQQMTQQKLIQQNDYVAAKYQQFEFLPQTDGSYIIKCQGVDLVWDVQGARVDNKTPIQLWPPNNFTNQRFSLTFVP